MIGLKKWINDKSSKDTFTMDGHIHLFNKDWSFANNKYPLIKKVGFIDIEPKFIDSYQECLPYYQNYIDYHYNSNNTILLASSTNQDEMIEMHKKWPDIIKGFGEIKCYADWKGEKLNLDKLSKYWKVFKYAEENKLPIYIHFSLYDEGRVKRFTNLLNKYPNVKVVLCHCGMDEFTENPDFAFYSVIDLMNKFSNLYTDISYTAINYFVGNPMRLLKLKSNRVIFGTDLNEISSSKPKKFTNNYNKLKNLSKFINSDNNLQELFDI